MLPLSRESYMKVFGKNASGGYTGTEYNIFNNSNIKAVFITPKDNNIADLVFSKTNPYTYLTEITSSPTRFPLANNLGFYIAEEDPGSNYTTDFANELRITGKITINESTFDADGTTDQFVFLVDESVFEVVSYVKLNSDTDNTIMNNITEVAYTDDIVNTNNLYTSTELTFSAGMVDFIQGKVPLSSLKICIIKDKDSTNNLYTYSTILSSDSIHALSALAGGDRIKLLSQGHPLSGFDFKRYYQSSTFALSLTASETVVPANVATQGFSPPYRGILYDIETRKPLVMFSESLGIEGQDNVFVKADSTTFNGNLMVMAPGS